MTPKERWNKMVKDSTEAEKDFQNLGDDNAILWAHKTITKKAAEIERLRELVWAMYSATIARPLTDKQHKYLESIRRALAGGEG
jgi:hypothetical protein